MPAGLADQETETVSASKTSPADPPIFFIHIPKTGGNTVISHFLAFLPVEQTFPPLPELTLPDAQLERARELLPRLRFLHGHTEGRLAEILPLDQVRLVTFIRHPVRLVVSHYLHFRYSPELAMHRVAKAFDIAGFLRRFPSYGTNPQARYLSRSLGLSLPVPPGETMDLVGQGLAALERMAFVGITEKMDASLQAMSEVFGVPCFPVGRHNESRASRDEALACEAVVLRDEFLMRLGADLALRLEAERRLDHLLESRQTAAACAGLVAGLAGKGPMPWVVARDGAAAVAFLDGWFPQGWVGTPAPETAYWWTSDRARLVVASSDRRPVRLRMTVIQTVGFPPANIALTAGGKLLSPDVVELPGGSVQLTWQIDAPAFRRHGGATVVVLKGPRAMSFADLDPASTDFDLRGFAVRDIRVLQAEP